jgi:hypothetical protein
VAAGSNVKPQAIAWLWRDWLAHGLHVLAGRLGSLKTTTLGFAAAVSVGSQLPDGSPTVPGKVVMWYDARQSDISRPYFLVAMSTVFVTGAGARAANAPRAALLLQPAGGVAFGANFPLREAIRAARHFLRPGDAAGEEGGTAEARLNARPATEPAATSGLL